MLHYRGRRLAGGASVLRSIGGGFTYVIAHREVFWIIAVTFITGALGMSIFHGIIAKWAAEVLQLAPGQYGQLASLWGIGTLVTAYSLAFVGHVPRKGSLFIWASVAFGASFLLFALTRSIPLAALAYLINGAAWTAANICAAGIVQGLVPNEVRGRVMSLFLMNGAAAQLSGLALGGIADLVGMPALMVGATAACTLSVLVLIALVPTLRHIDRLVAERTSAASAAALAVDLAPVPSVAAARGPD
jgi:predicted MFS family arabinose efflux permease